MRLHIQNVWCAVSLATKRHQAITQDALGAMIQCVLWRGSFCTLFSKPFSPLLTRPTSIDPVSGGGGVLFHVSLQPCTQLLDCEMEAVGEAVGWLNIFNPFRADGHYRLNFSRPDEKRVAAAVVELAKDPMDARGSALRRAFPSGAFEAHTVRCIWSLDKFFLRGRIGTKSDNDMWGYFVVSVETIIPPSHVRDCQRQDRKY